jgi:hypothetical protein
MCLLALYDKWHLSLMATYFWETKYKLTVVYMHMTTGVTKYKICLILTNFFHFFSKKHKKIIFCRKKKLIFFLKKIVH